MINVEHVIFLKFKKSYPHIPCILQDMIDGLSFDYIATKYCVPTQTVRNIHQRYKEYLNG